MGKAPPGSYVAGLLIPQWLLVGMSLLGILLRLNLRIRIQRISLTASIRASRAG